MFGMWTFVTETTLMVSFDKPTKILQIIKYAVMGMWASELVHGAILLHHVNNWVSACHLPWEEMRQGCALASLESWQQYSLMAVVTFRMILISSLWKTSSAKPRHSGGPMVTYIIFAQWFQCYDRSTYSNFFFLTDTKWFSLIIES